MGLKALNLKWGKVTGIKSVLCYRERVSREGRPLKPKAGVWFPAVTLSSYRTFTNSLYTHGLRGLVAGPAASSRVLTGVQILGP